MKKFKVTKVTVRDGRTFLVPMRGYQDATKVEIVELTAPEFERRLADEKAANIAIIGALTRRQA